MSQILASLIAKANYKIFKNLVENNLSLYQYMMDNTNSFQRAGFKFIVSPNELNANTILFFMWKNRPELARMLEKNKEWLDRQIVEFKREFPNI